MTSNRIELHHCPVAYQSFPIDPDQLGSDQLLRRTATSGISTPARHFLDFQPLAGRRRRAQTLHSPELFAVTIDHAVADQIDPVILALPLAENRYGQLATDPPLNSSAASLLSTSPHLGHIRFSAPLDVLDSSAFSGLCRESATSGWTVATRHRASGAMRTQPFNP